LTIAYHDHRGHDVVETFTFNDESLVATSVAAYTLDAGDR